MTLITCPECKREISDQAHACPCCGYPLQAVNAQAGEMEDETESTASQQQARPGFWSAGWQAATKLRAPINLFAVALMICAAVFGYSATRIDVYAFPAFIYALHTFLAIAIMFFLCLLYCRRAIYHPDDLAEADRDGVDMGPDRPTVVVIIILLMMAGYGLFQGIVTPDQFTSPSKVTELSVGDKAKLEGLEQGQSPESLKKE